MRLNRFELVFGLICALCVPAHALAAADIQTEKQQITYEILATGLNHPWSLVFLPDGDMLVSERTGRLLRINQSGKSVRISGLPAIQQYGQGGLLGLALHPNFEKNNWLYFSFAEKGKGGYGTGVARGKLFDDALREVEVLFRLLPKTGSSHHFGSRLLFDRQGYLYVTLGDRGERSRAQDLNDHAGSLIRLYDDGRVPEDNPFVGQPGAKPEIYSYGHRNLQGIALHPTSGRVWLHEHGPQGGDELNIAQHGTNYGWPVISYGVEYGFGTKIGEGTHKPGMAQPVYYWVPSIAPSGMTFYQGDAFKTWWGNLFIGSLKFRQLVRLELDGDKVMHEERMLTDTFGRIRDVIQGPDGLLYLLTDESDGSLIRLKPSQEDRSYPEVLR